MNIKRISVWVMALVPLVATLALLPSMADQVPAHYGINGMVDRYDSKYTMLVFPVIIIVVVLLRDLMPRWMVRDDEAQAANVQVVDKMILPIVVVLGALNIMTLWLAYYQVENIYTTSVNVPQLIMLGLSGLFVVIGNVMPKTKPNHFVGFRVPWTINHPEVWYKTHRFGGVVMTVWGVIGVLVALFWADPVNAFVIIIGGTLSMVVIVLGYAYVQYRQLMQRGRHE